MPRKRSAGIGLQYRLTVAALALLALLLPQAVLNPALLTSDGLEPTHPHFPAVLAHLHHQHGGSDDAGQADNQFQFFRPAPAVLALPPLATFGLLLPEHRGTFVPVSSQSRPEEPWRGTRPIRGPPLSV